MEKEPDSDDHAAAIVLRQQQFELTLRTIFPEDYAPSVSYGPDKDDDEVEDCYKNFPPAHKICSERSTG